MLRIFICLSFAGLLPLKAIAQGLTAVSPAQRYLASEKKQLGWIPHAMIGANLSFTSNESVVGQTNGSSQTYGLNFKGELNRVTEQTEWRNSLIVQEATTRTASLPRYLKSADNFRFDTTFLYSLPNSPKIGPYVHGDVESSLFNGEDVRENATDYVIRNRDGSSSTFTGSTLHLTDPFRPLTTRESAGFFWKALEEDKISLEARLGIGAMQVIADQQYAVKGKNAQGVVEVDQLKSFQQLGAEAGLFAKGKIDDRSAWEANATVLTPFIVNREPGDDRSNVRLTNVEFTAKLSTAITSWASFGYDYKLRIQPQLVDQTQQTHLLVLNVNYNLL